MIDSGDFRWFEITPVDAWFFRDGRPSNRGEDQDDLQSEFPPSTATVIGGIRAALARSQGWDGRGPWDDRCARVLGDGPVDLGSLSVIGPCLREGGSVLWPMPRHVVGHFEQGHDTCGIGRRFIPTGRLVPSARPVMTDSGAVHLPTFLGDAKQPPQPPDDVYVTTDGMNEILRGERLSPEACRTLDQLIQVEPRVGIGRDPVTRVTGDSALYHPRYIRLGEKVSIALGVKGIPADWHIPQLMPLGGESRMAGVEPITSPTLPTRSTSPHEAVVSGQRIVVNLTPGRFGQPWWGAGPGDPASRLGLDLDGRVVTVALDRPSRIGGWDFRRKGPLPIVPYVPAGTVWWIDECATPTAQLTRLGERSSHGCGLACVAPTV